MKKINKKRSLYTFLILVLILLIFFFSFRAYNHYTVFKIHKGYFKQLNPNIESWMTVHLIIKRFNIAQDVIFKELNVTNTISNQRSSIDSICKKNHLNCTQVINRLNKLKT